jgi:hypothetical protein
MHQIIKEQTPYIQRNFQLWNNLDNYAGETYYNYYPIIGQHRDSNVLEQSNFDCFLAQLGGESKTVKVIRAGHWAVGWVETVMIHKSDFNKLELADKIQDELERYPVVNEDDYMERQHEYVYELWKDLGLDGRIDMCHRNNVSIFAARQENQVPEECYEELMMDA